LHTLIEQKYTMLNGISHNWSIILIDMKKLLHQSIDWQLVLDLLRKYNLCNAGGATIIFLAQLISIPPHEDINFIIHSSKANWFAYEMLSQLTLDAALHTSNNRILSVFTFRHRCSSLLHHVQASTKQLLIMSKCSGIFDN